jgi:hypothetical protein
MVDVGKSVSSGAMRLHPRLFILSPFAALSSEAFAPGGSRDGDEPFAQTGALPPLFGEFILAESLILRS